MNAPIPPRAWTRDETTALYGWYFNDGLSSETIGQKLGRTAASVEGKLRGLRKLNRTRANFTAAMGRIEARRRLEQAITERWHKLSTSDIARDLRLPGHTISAIATELKLGRNSCLPNMAKEANSFPKPKGITRAQIAWAKANPASPEARLILGMAKEPILRFSRETGFTARGAA